MKKTQKRFSLLVTLVCALVLVLSLGIVSACGAGESESTDGEAKLPDDAGGSVIAVEGGSPKDSLGSQGDVCLCAESGKLYRKTAEGWVEAAYQNYNVNGNSLTVTYRDGSTGTYALTSEGGTQDCAHEQLESAAPVVIYESKCVIPGIGVKTCPDCHESFPVILPATGEHIYEEGGYTCSVCGETNYFRNGKIEGGRFVIKDMRDVPIKDGVLEIPGKIDGREVVIGEEAFGSSSHGQNGTLKSVVIGEGVKEIDEHAFHGCTELESVVLPESLTILGAAQDGALATNYQSIFEGCTSLTSVTFKGDVTVIGNRTFYGCSSLSEIVLPDSLEVIGAYAFDFSGLEEIVLPANVELGTMAFANCALTSVTFQGVVQTSAVGNNKTKCAGISNGCFLGCEKLGSIVLPEEITAIGNTAFSGCKMLTEIVIPAEVTIISDEAFKDCTSLASLIFAEGSKLKTFGAHPFMNSVIESVVLPATVETMGTFTYSAFHKCSRLKHIYYLGNAENLKNMKFLDSNEEKLFSFYSADPPAAAGSYWRYENGVPTLW